MADESRRPAGVVERDSGVLRALAASAKPLAQIGTELSLASNQVYGSLWRLRRDGLAEKARVGGRTPVWQLTQAGATQLGVPLPVRAEAPPAAVPTVEAPAPVVPEPPVQG